jgi:hypothetical protein
MIPLKIDNLFIVGRSASYSSVAAGSTRVVPVGIVEGQSIGICAVYSIVKNLTPREISKNEENIKELTKLLKGQGVYLPEFDIKNSNTENWSYESVRKLLPLGILSSGYKNDFKFNNDAKCGQFINLLIAGIRRSSPEKYKIDQETKIMQYYQDLPLTKIMACKIIAALFNIDISSYNEAKLWDVLYEKGYITEQSYNKGKEKDILKNEDIFTLGVNLIERYCNKELKK